MGTLAVWINVRLIRQGKRIINQQERRKERRKRRAKKQSIIQLGPLRTSITQKKNIYKYIYLYSFKVLKNWGIYIFRLEAGKTCPWVFGTFGTFGTFPVSPLPTFQNCYYSKTVPEDCSPAWFITAHVPLIDWRPFISGGFRLRLLCIASGFNFQVNKKNATLLERFPSPLPPATFSIKLSSKPGWCGVMETRFFKEHSSGHFEGDLRQS